MGYPEGEYPDLPGLVQDLHAGGFKVLGYLNTQFIVGRPRTDEGVAKGYFLKRPDGESYLVPGPDPNPDVGIRYGTMALYDPTNPEGVAWWQGLLRQMLIDTGYDGWMHDFGEYTPRDAVFADGHTGEEIRNLYPTLYQRTAAEICRQVKPDFSFFVRSGSIGSNQWAPSAWPGDQHTDWSFDRGLPSIIPAALSVGICGTNTWGPDIGGFFDAYDGSDVATSTELWIRWCQFGALTPLMRDHLGPKRMSTPDAIDMWSNEQTIDTWRRYARLHNALVPYLYAYARNAQKTGVPTMRHMVLHSPDQPEALQQDYQYLLGEELLVAPVVEPGATTRRVWFPPGTWYGFWDETTYSGPGYTEVPAPIEQIPLFVRAGSVLPLMTQPVVTLAGVAADDLLQDLELRLYPSAESAPTSGSFTFHDGSTIKISSSPERLTLALDDRTRSRQMRLRLPASHHVAGITADGASLPEPEVAASDGWSGAKRPIAGVVMLPLGTAEAVLQH
jgi:alpha-glucosidase (family GH31 glycosyl hydrolase)